MNNPEYIPNFEGTVCPIPNPHDDIIILGHGSGGRLSHNLIQKHFLPHFDNPILQRNNDAAVIELFRDELVGISESGSLVISTDSHVVSPLFFAGGDIGRLAVCGTVNDISMMGAKPLYITAGFILEEGLSIQILELVVQSMKAAASLAGVQIIAGDTKVVERGKADCIYINTSGIGILDNKVQIHGANAQPGDLVILSGTIGDHGIAVLEARGDLGFQTDIASDIAPLNHLVESMTSCSLKIHTLRDPTRGGLATSLNEIAQQSAVGIILEEDKIPVKPAVAAACEMLGFDPLYVANEGKLIAIVDSEDAEKVLEIIKKSPYGQQAAIIGEVHSNPRSRVIMKTRIGTSRLVDTLTGEMLPRIC